MLRKIIALAEAEVGITESPAGSNRQKYGAAYGYNGVQWCVQFIWWLFDRAGASDLFCGGGKTASCGYVMAWAQSHGLWVTDEYQAGDLLIFDFNNDKKQEHIGLCIGHKNGKLLTIEGNTALGETGSQSNGGAVAKRERAVKTVLGAYRPAYDTEEKRMNTVKGSSKNEVTMIKAVQAAIGAIEDGQIGAQTMSDIARTVGAKCWPLTLSIYQMPVIIAEDIRPVASPKKGLSAFPDSINGSFSASGAPCAICVADGNTVQQYACHYWHNKPESVLYRRYDGSFGVTRIYTADDLPTYVKWAVGGMGLLANYDPKAEGFCKCTTNGKTEDFSDVLRDTDHAVLGVKGNHVYMVLCRSMTASQVNAFAKKLGLDIAIMMDGGHIAGMNGGEAFARINTGTRQYFLIQGVEK